MFPAGQDEESRDESNPCTHHVQANVEPARPCVEQEHGHTVAVKQFTLPGTRRGGGKVKGDDVRLDLDFA